MTQKTEDGNKKEPGKSENNVYEEEDRILEIEYAHKRFGAVLAVDNVSFHLKRGEILALLGDNGAGKSTLIKALSGVHPLDSGIIRLNGEEVHFKSPNDARRNGIETVYQDLALFDNLTVAANLYAGREKVRYKGFGPLSVLNEKQMEDETRSIIADLQVNLPNPRSDVGLMSGGQRQAIAVARAAAFGSTIVLLDEPTAALGARESRNVLNLVKRLPKNGVSVIIISHNLEHVTEVADRAVVLRRGRYIGEAVPNPENHDHIIRMIVGGKARA